MDKIRRLDLADANIVAGGNAYDGNNRTSDNTIGYIMFRYMNFEELILPKTVTKIDNASLSWCTALSKIIWPENLSVIGGEAFAYCNNLSEIAIPESVNTIGFCAFLNCPIETITIPKNVQRIEYTAFGQCSKLIEIHIKALPSTLTSIGSTLADYEKVTVYVPMGTKEEYYLTELGNFKTIIEE